MKMKWQLLLSILKPFCYVSWKIMIGKLYIFTACWKVRLLNEAYLWSLNRREALFSADEDVLEYFFPFYLGIYQICLRFFQSQVNSWINIISFQGWYLISQFILNNSKTVRIFVDVKHTWCHICCCCMWTKCFHSEMINW